jgi:hypothetical protein
MLHDRLQMWQSPSIAFIDPEDQSAINGFTTALHQCHMTRSHSSEHPIFRPNVSKFDNMKIIAFGHTFAPSVAAPFRFSGIRQRRETGESNGDMDLRSCRIQKSRAKAEGSRKHPAARC